MLIRKNKICWLRQFLSSSCALSPDPWGSGGEGLVGRRQVRRGCGVDPACGRPACPHLRPMRSWGEPFRCTWRASQGGTKESAHPCRAPAAGGGGEERGEGPQSGAPVSCVTWAPAPSSSPAPMGKRPWHPQFTAEDVGARVVGWFGPVTLGVRGRESVFRLSACTRLWCSTAGLCTPASASALRDPSGLGTQEAPPEAAGPQ